jgi:hypothetical protein
MLRRLAIVMALALAAFSAASAQTVRVNVRFGEHADFSRIVFDWDREVAYRIEREGGGTFVRFDAAALLVADSAPAKPLRQLRSFAIQSGERPQLRLELAPNVELRDARWGNRVVLDLYPVKAGARAQTSPEALASAGPGKTAGRPVEAAAPAPKAPADSRPTVPVPGEVALMANSTPAALAALQNTPRRLVPPPPAIPIAEPPPGKGDGRQDPAPPLRSAPAGKPGAGNPPALPAAAQAPPSPSQNFAPEVTLAPAPSEAPAPRPKQGFDLDPIRVSLSREAGNPVLQFSGIDLPAVAVFLRSGDLWVAFSSGRTFEASALKHAEDFGIGGVESLALLDGAGLRILLKGRFNPTVKREGEGWRVELRASPTQHASIIPVEVRGAGPERRVFVPLPESPILLTINDPNTGRAIYVSPVSKPAMGLPEARSYPEFILPNTAQGAVIEPRADPVVVYATAEGISVSVAHGLLITNDQDRSKGAAGHELSEHRLFDTPLWASEEMPFFERRQELVADVVAASPARRAEARIRLAKFLLASGFASEANAVIRLAEEDKPPPPNDLEHKALRAATALLARDFEAAERELASPELEGEAEIELWRAAFAAFRGDNAGAVRSATGGWWLLADYTPRLRRMLGFPIAESAIAVKDLTLANSLVQMLAAGSTTAAEESAIRVLQGDLAYLGGELEQAEALWKSESDSQDIRSRTRARIKLADLLLEQGRMKPQQAIEMLDPLRFGWRGDVTELGLLDRLARLYGATDRTRDALLMLKQIASRFPQTESGRTAPRQMRETFERFFLGPEMAAVPAVTVAAMFEEFRELIPTGEAGSRMIVRVADRLIGAELLTRAEALLTAQFEKVTGAAKVEAGTKLALVRLQDNRPTQALAMLEQSEGEMSLPTMRERRMIAARALVALKREEQALTLLGGDSDPDILAFKAEINWRRANWLEAANALAEIIGFPDPKELLAPERARQVLQYSVAIALAGDQLRLADARRRFGHLANTPGPFQTEFKVVLAASDTRPLDLAGIAERLAGISNFRRMADQTRPGATPPATPERSKSADRTR